MNNKRVSKLDAIVNAILLSASERGVNVTNYRLQKLLYFVCGYWIGFFDEWLLDADQNFQAQENGPVLEAVEIKYSKFEEEPIPLPDTRDLFVPTSVQCVINDVVDKYGNCTTTRLREITHTGPWIVAYKQGRNVDIDQTIIKNYFKQELKVPSKLNASPKVRAIHSLEDTDHTKAIKIAESLGI